jgi:hypothetical protein
LHDTRTHLREDIEKVDEPRLKAMFETAAERSQVWKRLLRITNRERGGWR